MKNLLLGLACLVMSVYVSAQQVAKGLTAANGTYIGFYEYKPTDYDANPTTKYPLIVFLHGMGERGNGTTQLNRVLNNAIPKYINGGHKMRFFWNGKWETFIVLSPQLSETHNTWQNFYVEEMINYAKANLRIDTNRIAVTGLSLGGGGVWRYATGDGNAQKLSSVAAICPTCENATWCNLGSNNVPTWAFHAVNDPTTQYNCTSAIINALGACAGNQVKPYFTPYSSGGHSIWDAAYDTTHNRQNPNIYEWLLGQNKSLPYNKRPKAHAGNNITISSNPGIVTLSALGSTDEDGQLVRFIWTKISGPSFGNIQTPVSTNGITTVTNLTQPGTYVFEVKAVDDRADYSTATVTVTVVSGSVPNIAPVTIAGPDRSTDMSITTLDGSNSFDPDGTITNYQWTKISGPPIYNLSGANSPTPTVSNLLVGTYEFELRTTDNRGAVTSDTVVVYSVGTPLPVKLKSFKASSTGSGAELHWITEIENGNDHFVVERSEDGTNFTAIGTVKGQGYSTALQEYKLTDPQPATGIVYYRLSQVSFDGKTSQLQVATITGKALLNYGITYFPNPVHSSLTLQVRQKEKGVMKINLYSLDGKLLKAKQLTKHDELFSTSLDIRDLGRGVYMLEVIINDRQRETMKVIKQ